ncbi:NADPH-dependent F420 reductase [Actinomycetospora sp. CA-053990]|uniref:NADPH-dependent F420 reductase n=1 Tax=Actinomycetospora sp. CA-053990 TaxID=3239891 RepID=UPI003D8C8D68
MRIAVIGAGNVGGGFARAAVAAGHEVVVTAAHADKAEGVAAESGARAAASNLSAVEGAQVVVLAVPGTVAPAVVAELAPALQDAVVVDATNPLNASFSGLDVTGISGAEDVQQAAGSVPVVKAFNTVFASRYAASTENGEPLQVLMAGDDADAKARVADVATSLGFAPVDAGGLRLARALEEMAFLNITLNATNGWAWQSAWQLVGPTA